MTSRQSEPLSRYQFVTAPYRIDRPLSYRQENQDQNSKNAKISFRYLAECQENQKRIASPVTDLTRYGTTQDPGIQSAKNYTFSVLSKEGKQTRRTEGIGLTSNFPSNSKYQVNLPKKPALLDHCKKVQDRPEQNKQSKISKQEHYRDKQNQHELSDLRQECCRLSEQVSGLTMQNELLTVRLQDSKKRLQEHETLQNQNQKDLKIYQQKIEFLEASLANMKINQEKDSCEIQNLKEQLAISVKSKPKLKKQSHLVEYCIEIPQTNSFLKKTREQTLSIASSYFQEEYKQIAVFLGVEPIHQIVSKELLVLKKKNEQNDHLSLRLTEIEKEKAKLLHILKKQENNFNKVIKHNDFLSLELEKHIKLVSDLNSQIQGIHLSHLQEKLAHRCQVP